MVGLLIRFLFMMATNKRRSLHWWRVLSPASEVLYFASDAGTAWIDAFPMSEKTVCVGLWTGAHRGVDYGRGRYLWAQMHDLFVHDNDDDDNDDDDEELLAAMSFSASFAVSVPWIWVTVQFPGPRAYEETISACLSQARPRQQFGFREKAQLWTWSLDSRLCGEHPSCHTSHTERYDEKYSRI